MDADGGAGREFVVKSGKREVVAAPLPKQEHWLPLSNLDLLLPPLDIGVFFCYANSTTIASQRLGYGSVVGVLKAALAQALVSYYAIAGEVVQNSAGEPELLCNNQGVDFIKAFVDVELRHINLYNPDDTVEGKLVPKEKRGVLAVQVLILDTASLYIIYPSKIISPLCLFHRKYFPAFSSFKKMS
ncbi:hypothetical protein EUGRSUZ_E02693 [Eucalyptus grandis]|uniref:Uncharacterized protein n=2 Tax=Eucalyptus grandis TaxID=71139 RepID=A0ACC3KYG1_EUCGR|nr:hypothetical protein EUGRSUZ_E02693 [Eucalyptus grandis]